MAPLTSLEAASIWQWQRHMYIFYGIAMALIAVAFIAVESYRELRAVRLLALLLTGLLIAVGAYIQFRERCPRCSARIGRQARLMMPEACAECGVAFPLPPKRQ